MPGFVGEKRRRLRILPEGGYFVHVTSRAARQAFLFGETEKTAFLELARRWADFSGISILTHCLMDNHFHLLLWVPERREIPHAEILARLSGVWSEEKVACWEETWGKLGMDGKKALEVSVTGRMWDLPEYMRVLKQNFTRWYNRRSGKKGTFWDCRYRSVVVEDNPLALLSVAAYIDLNPVRAGLVDDPVKYGWSGYGEACGGGERSQKGLEWIVRLSRGHQPAGAEDARRKQLVAGRRGRDQVNQTLRAESQRRAVPRSWKEVQASYRVWLYAKGVSRADDPWASKRMKERKGLDPVKVVEVFEARGEVPVSKLLRTRIQAFTRGAALGGDGFLEGLMEKFRGNFGTGRKRAGKNLKGRGWPGLKTLRKPSS